MSSWRPEARWESWDRAERSRRRGRRRRRRSRSRPAQREQAGTLSTGSSWRYPRNPCNLHKASEEIPEFFHLSASVVPSNYAEGVVVPSCKVSDFCHRQVNRSGSRETQSCRRQHAYTRYWRGCCKYCSNCSWNSSSGLHCSDWGFRGKSDDRFK